MELKIHAGDFGKGNAFLHVDNYFAGEDCIRFNCEKSQTIPLSMLLSIEMVTEENAKKLVGTIALGSIGAFLLGPVGFAAGVLAGGNKKNITFIATYKDGRKFLGTSNNKDYIKLQSAVFNNLNSQRKTATVESGNSAFVKELLAKAADNEAKKSIDTKKYSNPNNLLSQPNSTCFVASATYGNAEHPDVRFLKTFRDEYLIYTFAGRIFINTYWIIGPKLSILVQKSLILKNISRWIISKSIILINRYWMK
jgi:hypothetical protein